MCEQKKITMRKGTFSTCTLNTSDREQPPTWENPVLQGNVLYTVAKQILLHFKSILINIIVGSSLMFVKQCDLFR